MPAGACTTSFLFPHDVRLIVAIMIAERESAGLLKKLFRMMLFLSQSGRKICSMRVYSAKVLFFFDLLERVVPVLRIGESAIMLFSEGESGKNKFKNKKKP